MFGLEQAYIKKTKICLDCPSGPPKCQICSDWPIRPQKMSNLFDWPQNYHFCMAKCKYTNKQCHNSFPSETGYFLPTPIHSLSFHSGWRGLSRVSMMMGFWGVIGLSKYPVCKTINKWEIVKIHLAAEWHPSHEYFLGVFTPSDLQNQENMYQWYRKL